MKNLQDRDFKKLNEAVSLSRQSKDNMKQAIVNTKIKHKRFIFPKLLGSLLTIFVIGLAFMLMFNPFNDHKLSQGEIIDSQTPETLPKVELVDDMFTMEWHSDSMDRGNHDLQSNVHGNLVVSEKIQPIKRGDILFYKINEQELIGRVIGLPGETVMIRDGQVYIDNKKLNTFYGVATSMGLTREEYLKEVDKSNINETSMEDFFNTSIDPVFVEENTVFVLVDTWWRGRDSIELGLIPFDQVEGKVLGYEKVID
ncbi:signal peptidase I [Oceanobacillus luteolus]|uniref:Signal peptidase I n=1 Tax=Oceanobacillus luteolus TaxID=1274358 RepID=A0ABW4HUM5_9BACI|nr:signal peptidase I [Oceanobacillus luteolus]MCM3742430.1 signal peptidase I [Oceanobacillus luteolus]